MLKSVATAFLCKYFGAYVDGISQENLTISVSEGHVELEKLSVKRSVLDSLELPIKVKEGWVGGLRMSIPWTEIRSKPAVVSVREIFLLVGPADASDGDAEEEEERMDRLFARKMQLLTVARLLGRDRVKADEEAVVQGEDEAGDDGGGGLISNLVALIAANLQVFVEEVHIRYEDSISVPGRTLGAGVTLQHLHAQTTDNEWRPAFVGVDHSEHEIFKAVALRNFAVYLDPFSVDEQHCCAAETTAQRRDILMSLIYRTEPPSDGNATHTIVNAPRVRYIVKPVSGDLRVTLVPGQQASRPKATVQCNLPAIDVEVDEQQYEATLDVIGTFSQARSAEKYQRYARFKPVEQVPDSTGRLVRRVLSKTADLRGWWAFAINSVVMDLREEKATWSAEHIHQFVTDKRAYIELYSRQALGEKLGEEDVERLERIEWVYSYDDLLMFRTIANTLADKRQKDQKEVEETKAVQQQQQGWLSYAWNMVAGDADSAVSSPDLDDGALLKEIYTIVMDSGNLKKLSDRDDVVLLDEYVKYSVSVEVERMSFTVLACDASPDGNSFSRRQLTSGVLELFELDATQHPTSTRVHISVGDVVVTDQFTPSTCFPALLYRSGLQSNVLSVSFVVNPLQSAADYQLKCVMRPLNVVVPRMLLDRMYLFFITPVVQRRSLRDLELAAQLRLQNLRDQTTDQLLRAALETRGGTAGALDLELDVAAPNIIVPRDEGDADAPLLVVVLGSLEAKSDLRASERRQVAADGECEGSRAGANTIDTSLLYDRYGLKVQEARAVLTSARAVLGDACDGRGDGLVRPSLQLADGGSDGQVNLVLPFTVDVTMGICRVHAPTLTAVTADVQVPSFCIRLAPTSIARVGMIIDTVLARKPDANAVGIRDELSSSTVLGNDDGEEIANVPIAVLLAERQHQRQVQRAKELRDIAQRENQGPKVVQLEKKAEIRVAMQEVCICLYEEGTSVAGSKDPVVLETKGMSASVQHTTHSTMMEAVVSSFGVRDNLEKGYRWLAASWAVPGTRVLDGEELIADAEVSEDLVRISYEFSPKHILERVAEADGGTSSLVQHAVCLQYNTLHILCSHNTLLWIYRYARHAVEEVRAIRASPEGESAPEEQTAPRPEGADATGVPIGLDLSEARWSLFSLNARLRTLTATLHRQGDDIAFWKLSSSHISVRAEKRKLHATGSLGRMQMLYRDAREGVSETDAKSLRQSSSSSFLGSGRNSARAAPGCTPNRNPMMKIMSTEGENTATIDLEYHFSQKSRRSKRELTPQEQRHLPSSFRRLRPDVCVMLKMSSLRVVYLQAFVRDVLQYIEEFKGVKEIANAQAARVAEAWQASTSDLKKRVEVQIVLLHPQIVYPRSILCEECLFSDLGHIVIATGEYCESEVRSSTGWVESPEGNLVVTRITVDVQGMGIQTGVLDAATLRPKQPAHHRLRLHHRPTPVLNDTSFFVGVDKPKLGDVNGKQALPPEGIAGMTVNVDVAPVKVEISEYQFDLALGVVEWNVCDLEAAAIAFNQKRRKEPNKPTKQRRATGTPKSPDSARSVDDVDHSTHKEDGVEERPWVEYRVFVNLESVSVVILRHAGLFRNPMLVASTGEESVGESDGESQSNTTDSEDGKNEGRLYTHWYSTVLPEPPLPPQTERCVSENDDDAIEEFWRSTLVGISLVDTRVHVDMWAAGELATRVLMRYAVVNDLREHADVCPEFTQIMVPRSLQEKVRELNEGGEASGTPGMSCSTDAVGSSTDILLLAAKLAEEEERSGAAAFQFDIRWRKCRLGSKELDVRIDRSFGFLIPEIWVRAYDVIMPMKDRLLRTVAVYQQHLKAWSLPPTVLRRFLRTAHDNETEFPDLKDRQDALLFQHTGSPPPPLPLGGLSTYSVTVTNPDAYFVENAASPTSLALALHTTCIVKYTSDERNSSFVFTTDYQHAEIYKCEMASPNSAPVSLVAPFRLMFRWASSPDSVSVTWDFVEGMSMTISYRDFLLMRGIYLLWVPGVSNDRRSAEPPAAPQPPPASRRGLDPLTAAVQDREDDVVLLYDEQGASIADQWSVAEVGHGAAPSGDEHKEDRPTGLRESVRAWRASSREERSEEEAGSGETDRGGEYREQQLTVRYGNGARLALINDVSVRTRTNPLVLVHFDAVELDLFNWSSYGRMRAHCALSVDYYNNGLEVWEPMLEPWSMEMNSSDTVESRTLVLIADTTLNLNVTKAFVETMLHTIDAINEDYSAQGSRDSASDGDAADEHAADSLSFAPYVIRNCIGEGIYYRLSGEKQTRFVPAGAEEPVELSVGAEVQGPDSADDAQQRMREGQRWRSRQAETHRTMSIRLESDRRWFSENPLHSTGTYPLQVDARDANMGSFEVADRHGSKVFTVRSRVVVVNNTSTALTIALTHSRATSDDHKIASGDSFFVPRTHARTGCIRIKPATDTHLFSDESLLSLDVLYCEAQMAQNSWSSATTTMRAWMGGERQGGVGGENKIFWKQTITCFCATPDAKSPFSLIAVAELTPTHQDIVVTMHSVLTLENLLPVPIRFTIEDLSIKKCMLEGQLDRGQERAVSETDGKRPVGIRVSVLNFGWCKRVLPLNTGSLVSSTSSRTSTTHGGGAVESGQADEHVIEFQDIANRSFVLLASNELDRCGVRRVRIYCHFWLINRTGLRLLYKLPSASNEDVLAGQVEQEQEDWRLEGDPVSWYSNDQRWHSPLLMHTVRSGPVFAMLSSAYLRAKVQLKIASSDWSEEFALASSGISGNLEILDGSADSAGWRWIGRDNRSMSGRRIFEVALSISSCPGRYWRSKRVVVAPRFVLVNDTDMVVRYRQPVVQDTTDHELAAARVRGRRGRQTSIQVQTSRHHDKDSEGFVLHPRSHLPFHWSDAAAPRLLQVQLVAPSERESEYEWSTRFSPERLGAFNVKLRHKAERSRYYLARVNVKLDGATNLIVISAEKKEFPDYRIDNLTNRMLYIKQAGCDGLAVVPPHSQLPYAWDDPAQARPRLELQFENTTTLSRVSMDRLGELPPIHLPNTRQTYVPEVCANGPTKVLSIESVEDRAERKQQAGKSEQCVRSSIVSIHGVGISFIDERPRELMYAMFHKIEVNYTETVTATTVELRVGRVQADNELCRTPYPLFVYPIVPPDQDFFHAMMSRSNTSTTIDFYHKIRIRVGEMEVKIDEEFFNRMMSFLNLVWQFWVKKTGKDQHVEKEIDEALRGNYLVPTASVLESKMVYIEELRLNPVRLFLTFTTSSVTGGVSGGGGDEQGNILHQYLRMGRILASIDAAPLKLNCLTLENPFMTRSELLEQVARHYQTAAIREWHKMLGSAEFLGSPITLFSNVGTGVYDFFHEPALGWDVSAKDFGIGLKNGSKSLVKKSVFGVSNTTSKIVGAFGTGAAAASFNPHFQRSREESRRERPKHAGEGLTHGVKDFSKGIFHGVTGVVVDPLTGMAEEGPKGFLKGVLRGVSGVLVKPAVGTLDGAAKVFEGIKNTTTYWDEKDRHRVRRPRYFAPDGILRAYSELEAEGQEFLWVLEKGRWADEWYTFHAAVEGGYLLLTNRSMIYVSDTGSEGVSAEWACGIKYIRGLQLTPAHIIVQLNRAISMSALQRPSETRLIHASNAAELRLFYDQLIPLLRMLRSSPGAL